MASLTIRNLDEGIKSKLRVRAATHGCSMEEEVRTILRNVLAEDSVKEEESLYNRIRRRFADVRGVDIPLPDREAMREPPYLE